MNPLADVHQYCANPLDGEMPDIESKYREWNQEWGHPQTSFRDFDS